MKKFCIVKYKKLFLRAQYESPYCSVAFISHVLRFVYDLYIHHMYVFSRDQVAMFNAVVHSCGTAIIRLSF